MDWPGEIRREDLDFVIESAVIRTEKEHRMKARQWAMGVTGAGVCLAAAHGLAQGSLTPPGAPAATMKTLAQIEPRIPISSAPYTITQPGSYYLTTNLSSTSYGIIIQANRVTVDLMGFSLTGDRGNFDWGIYVQGAAGAMLRDVVVRNGKVSDFGSGVMLGFAQNCRVTDLTVCSNSWIGVYLFGETGQCNWNTIAGCTISGNSINGVALDGSTGQCDGNSVLDCTISGNGSSGIDLFGLSGECSGNVIRNNQLSRNAGCGIHLAYISGNRIEDNHVWGQTGNPSYGIQSSSGTANLILKNSCVGQTNNFDLSASDTYGPIVTGSGALATTNGAAGLSPWANFSR